MTTILLEFAIRTSLIAAGTAAVLWLLRIRTASIRHAAWSAVVVTMLMLPLWLAAGVHLALPVLTPAPIETPVASSQVTVAPVVPAVQTAAEPAPDNSPAPSTSAPAPAGRMDWRPFLLGGYLVVAVMLLLRLVVGTVQANRLRREAVVHEGRLTSDRCATPITVGWFAPALILPRGWDGWSSEQLAVVLAHEQEHARRHDPLMQWFALLNRAAFWFHPLAWWLERRLATLAEEACDAAVIAAGHSPQNYSEYLLEMARAVAVDGGRVRLGMAMPGAGLSNRLQLIFRGLPAGRLSRARIAMTMVFCAVSSVMFASGTLVEQTLAPLTRQLGEDISLAAQRSLENPVAPRLTSPRAGAGLASEQKFELASIKPCARDAEPPPGRSGGWPRRATVSPGTARWECLTVDDLAYLAYASPATGSQLLNNKGVRRADEPEPVRGGPSWAHSERFTIEAKAAAATDQAALIGPMLRALLEDRFQLKTHRATEERPVYVLTLAKSGLNPAKVKPTGANDCVVRVPGTPPPQPYRYPCGGQDYGPADNGAQKVRWTGTTFKDFLNANSGLMDRFVVDKTGIDGRFNIEFEFVPDDRTPGYPWPIDTSNLGTGRSVFKGLEEIGLHLEPSKAPAEYIVIERVERPKSNESITQPTVQTSGQSQSLSMPEMQIKYEAVSIRPCDTSAPGTGRGGSGNSPRFAITPGFVSWGCASLSFLIDNAWGGAPPNNALLNTLPYRPNSDAPKRVRGGPSWVEDEKYAIEIRISGDTTDKTGSVRHELVNNAMGPALRAMLEDRFQLKVRKVTEERPMYALSVAAGGHKLTPLAPGDCVVWKEGMPVPPTRTGLLDGKWMCGVLTETTPLAIQDRLKAGEDRLTVMAGMSGQNGEMVAGPNRRMEGYGITLQTLARRLAGMMDRFVVDKTGGTSGQFMFALEYTVNENTPHTGWGMIAGQPEWPRSNVVPGAVGRNQTIFKSLEALGLKLEPTKGPAEYLLIESAQRPNPGLRP